MCSMNGVFLHLSQGILVIRIVALLNIKRYMQCVHVFDCWCSIAHSCTGEQISEGGRRSKDNRPYMDAKL